MLKLFKKDNQTRGRIIKKIQEIINSADVEYYKNLRHDLKDFKRVQIGEKVLVFKLLTLKKHLLTLIIFA